MLFTKPPRVEQCGDPSQCGSKLIVVPVFLGENDVAVIPGKAVGLLEKTCKDVESVRSAAQGKTGEIVEVPCGEARIVLLGLGKQEDLDASRVLRAYGKVGKQYAEKYEALYAIVEPLGSKAGEAVLGLLLGAYRLDAFRSERKGKLERVLVDIAGGYENAVIEAEGVYLARDIANAPPNEVYPERLAELLRDLFSRLENVSVEVFDYKRLVDEGFGGIVNVGKGSSRKPVLIVFHYKGAGDTGKPIALVGKTLVFDAGGINLKPSHSIVGMRMDKAGGAAVAGALWIIARKKMPVNVEVLMPAAINVPSGESYLPSDVIRMWDGTRVEVTNTDAEGRLVLADAIAYAVDKLGAEKVIELSTLTGAIVVALGPIVAGLFTRSKELEDKVVSASEETDEKVWPMPMVDEYKPFLSKGAKLGDIDNAGMRWGGAIYAALFLEKFAHGKDLVHLDIAGPGMGMDAGPSAPDYWPSGLAPGFGSRLVARTVEKLLEK